MCRSQADDDSILMLIQLLEDENLVIYLNNIDRIEPIPDAFFNPLYEKLKMALITGGMPESSSFLDRGKGCRTGTACAIQHTGGI